MRFGAGYRKNNRGILLPLSISKDEINPLHSRDD